MPMRALLLLLQPSELRTHHAVGIPARLELAGELQQLTRLVVLEVGERGLHRLLCAGHVERDVGPGTVGRRRRVDERVADRRQTSTERPCAIDLTAREPGEQLGSFLVDTRAAERSRDRRRAEVREVHTLAPRPDRRRATGRRPRSRAR